MKTTYLSKTYLTKYQYYFKISKFYIMSLVLLLLAGCQSNAGTENISGGNITSEEAIIIGNDTDYKEADYMQEPVSDPLEPAKRIKTAQIQIQTDSLSLLRDKIEVLMRRYNAYVHSEQLHSSNWDKRRKLQIKIPVQYFENFISDIQKTGDKITYLEIKNADVTSDYYDLEARLKNKKALKERYLSFYKKAKNINEVLSIERQINEIQTDIDRLEGKLKWLKHKTTYGTLDLELYQKPKNIPNKPVNPFWLAFQNGWQIFVGFLYILLGLWPLIFGFAVIFWIWKHKRKVLKK